MSGPLALPAMTTKRENGFARSDEFEMPIWSQGLLSVTANQIEGPLGGLTGDVVGNSATAASFYYIRQGPVLKQDTPYTASFYVKPKTGSGWVWIIGETNTDAFCWFDVGSGAVGTSTGFTARILPAPGGWWRCVATFVKTSATGSEEVGLGLTSGNGVTSFTPAGVAAQEVYLFGGQIVTGYQPGPYCRTSAAAGARYL